MGRGGPPPKSKKKPTAKEEELEARFEAAMRKSRDADGGTTQPQTRGGPPPRTSSMRRGCEEPKFEMLTKPPPKPEVEHQIKRSQSEVWGRRRAGPPPEDESKTHSNSTLGTIIMTVETKTTTSFVDTTSMFPYEPNQLELVMEQVKLGVGVLPREPLSVQSPDPTAQPTVPVRCDSLPSTKRFMDASFRSNPRHYDQPNYGV